MGKNVRRVIVKAQRFSQWLSQWDGYVYSKKSPNRKPHKDIYYFTMAAPMLRQYSDVYKRERENLEAEGIQRVRDEKRTSRIKEFVSFGYPYGDLTNLQREDKETLKKPGWLPTAIVINIMVPGDVRKGRKLAENFSAKILESGDGYKIDLPNIESFSPNDLRPFEVIDGQHRLWAFGNDDNDEMDNYELPVVAFYNLDIAWQAYLFWSINVSPKKINPSHAFDLYPLLRNQDWLEQNDDIIVYREARAQEITDWLYKHPESAWLKRINMLGERGAFGVSQAAFVRSLSTSLFGTGRGKTKRKGLFQTEIENINGSMEFRVGGGPAASTQYSIEP